MKVYSPSQTSTWMRCPVLRALRHEGWTSKYVGRPFWAATLGQGFAAGVGVYNNLRKDREALGQPAPARTLSGRVTLANAAAAVAISVIDQRLNEAERLGVVIDAEGVDYVKTIHTRAAKAVTAYVVSDPLPDTWRIVAVEESLGPEAGNARPDAVVRDTMGLAILDYKSKLTLNAQYRQKTINEFANGHQFLHYGHFGALKYQEPIDRYYIGLAVFEPRWAFDLLPFPLNAETQKVWFQGASVAWAAMEKEDLGLQAPWMSDRHSDQYGQCPMYKACFVHHFDAALMKQDYLLTERVPEEVPNEEAV